MNLKEFVNLRGAPEFLVGVISVVAFIFDLIPKLWIGILLVFLLVLWFINMVWIEPKVNLINEYNFLMKSLKKHDKNQEIERIISGWNPYSPPSHISAIQYFGLKRIDIDRKSNELNKKVLINFRYCLITTDTALIGKDFADLFIDIKP